MCLVELKVTHSDIEQFLSVRDALRIRIHWKKVLRMRLAQVMLIRMVVDKKLSLGRIQAHEHFRRLRDLCRIHLEIICKRPVRRNGSHL